MIRRAIIAAAVLKLCLAALTLGTNDMSFFRHFGWEILQHGLAAEYAGDPLFNHTPLVGGFATLVSMLSCGSERLFAFLLRAPGILMDAAVAFALVRRFERPALLWVLFAFSPTALMVSGFHGNVDALLAGSLVFAALAVDRGDVVRSAAWLALACNVKVAALYVAPVFFFHWMARKEGWRFLLLAGGGILLGWSPALAMCPVDFLHRVLGYAGYWGIWGITWVLKTTGAAAFSVVGSEDLPHAEVVLMQILKAALMAGGLAVAWLQRKGNIWLALALVWALFMVFASGVAAQYLIWPMALLFVAAPRCWLVAEAGNAVFLFVFYTVLCGGLPWYYGEANAVVNERWLPWTCVAWGAWIVCLCALARHARTASLGAPCSISASSAKIPTT